jgi:hypothetical protein
VNSRKRYFDSARSGDRPAISEPSAGGSGRRFVVTIPSVHVPTSAVLQNLSDVTPAEQITIGWLLERLHRHAFGMVILLLGVVGMVPGICVLAAFLLLIPAFEMIAGCRVPTFTRRIADRPFPTRYLTNAVRRAVPVLRHVEKAIHPRWRISPEIAKRIVGIAVALMAVLLVTPIPMIQVIPASVIVTIALAYIEDDGLLLAIATLGAMAVSVAAFLAIREMALGAGWIGSLF